MAAIPGRWGGLRAEPYKPNPPDADLDGIIQEQTLWERPKGFVIAIVDAAGRLAEVMDGADHPRGVNQFRRNFVLARRDDNGVLERADGAHTPSWANAPLSPGELNGTLGDNGTLADLRRGSGNVERAVEAVVDPPIDRRAELRKRYPDISDAGLEMMLWEPTDDPDEIDRRLGFIEDLYGEDVSTNLRQFLDGVPPGDRVDADFSEMADDLPGRPVYVNNYGDSPIDEISHAVFGFEDEADARAVCSLVPGVAGKSLASGMLAGLRVKAGHNCSVVGGEGQSIRLGDGPGLTVLAFGESLANNENDPGGSPDLDEPTPPPHAFSRYITPFRQAWGDQELPEGYGKYEGSVVSEMSDDEVADLLLKVWQDGAGKNQLAAIFVKHNPDFDFKQFEDEMHTHLTDEDTGLIYRPEFRNILDGRAKIYYSATRRVLRWVATRHLEGREDRDEESKLHKMYAGVVAMLSRGSEWGSNQRRARQLVDSLRQDEFELRLDRILGDTLTNGHFSLPVDSGHTVQERIEAINGFLDIVYADNADGRAAAGARLQEILNILEITDKMGVRVSELTKSKDERKALREKLKGYLDSDSMKKSPLEVTISINNFVGNVEEMDDDEKNRARERIATVEALLNYHLSTTSGRVKVRGAGGGSTVAQAMEMYFDLREADDQGGPKTESYFWSLFNDELERRGAVDTHVTRAMIPENAQLTFKLTKDGAERLNIPDPDNPKQTIPFDPNNKAWREAYKARYGKDSGVDFEQVVEGEGENAVIIWRLRVMDDKSRHINPDDPAQDRKWMIDSDMAYIDFVSTPPSEKGPTGTGWSLVGTVDALRAEATGTGNARLKNMIRTGGSEPIMGPDGKPIKDEKGNTVKMNAIRGWSYTIERAMSRAAEEAEVPTGVMQSGLWEYIRYEKADVRMVKDGFQYTRNANIYDNVTSLLNIVGDPKGLARYGKHFKDPDAPSTVDARRRDLWQRREAITVKQILGESLDEDDNHLLALLRTATEADIRHLASLRLKQRTGSQSTLGAGRKALGQNYEDMDELSPGLKALLAENPKIAEFLDNSYIMWHKNNKYTDNAGKEHRGIDAAVAALKDTPPGSITFGKANLGYIMLEREQPKTGKWIQVVDPEDATKARYISGVYYDVIVSGGYQVCNTDPSDLGKSFSFSSIELKAPVAGSCAIAHPSLPGQLIAPYTEVTVPENFADMTSEVADVVAHNILAGRDRSELGRERRLSRLKLFQEHPQHRGFYLREDGNFYDASDNMLADDGDIVPSPEFLEESDRALRALSEGIRKFDADAAKRASQRQDRLYGSTSDETEASPELIGQLRVAEAIGDNFVASVREMDDRYRQRAERPDGGGQFVYDLDEAARREKIREIEEAREQFSQSLQKFFDEERRYDPDNPPTVFMNTRSVAAREGTQRRSGGRPLTEAEAREEADRYRDIFKESLRELDEQAKRSEEWRNSERPMFRGPDRSYWSTSNIDSLSDSDRASRRSGIQEGLDNLWGEYGTGKGGDVTQRVGDSGGAYFQPPSDKAPEELLSTFASEKTSVLEEQLRTGRRRTAGGEVEMSDADRRETQTILDYLKNTSPEQQKKDIVDFLRRNVEDEDTVVAWRASPQTIGLVAEDGRIKTTHELEFSRPTGRTRADDVGATSPPTMRRAYETSIGIPFDTPDDERPVSGLVSYGPRRRRAAADILAQRQAELTPEEFALYDVRSDPLYMQAVSGAAEDYGTAMVEFKRDTNKKSTFVIGDSLNIGGVPAGMENASDEELLRMVFDDTYRNAPNSADVTSHDRFMEMMILGRDEALGEGYAGSWRLPDSKVGRDSGYHEALLPGGSGIADVETVFLDGQYNTQVPGYRSGRPSLEVLQEQDRWMSLIPDEERDMLDEIVRLRGADSSEVQAALQAWAKLLNQFDESESRREIEETLKKLNQDLKIQWLENRGVSLERRIAAAKERLGTDDPIDLLMRRNLEKLLEGIRKQHANLLGR